MLVVLPPLAAWKFLYSINKFFLTKSIIMLIPYKKQFLTEDSVKVARDILDAWKNIKTNPTLWNQVTDSLSRMTLADVETFIKKPELKDVDANKLRQDVAKKKQSSVASTSGKSSTALQALPSTHRVR